MLRKLVLLIIAGLVFSACLTDNQPQQEALKLAKAMNQPTPTPTPTITPTPTPQPKVEGTVAQAQQAVIKTSMGDITIQLFPDKTPVTVANFGALAEGTINWTHPQSGQDMKGTPLYNGTIFHRVVKDFMIQGGDPLGNGTGGPGYKFVDEIVPELVFDQAGLLAMANSGPNTNGSQFFITIVPTPWLNGKHTIFGKVTAGMDVVNAVVAVPTGANDKPLTDIVIEKIDIIRQ